MKKPKDGQTTLKLLIIVKDHKLTKATIIFALMSCRCACGRGKCNDNKDNHVVDSLIVYQGVVQWCCYMTPAYDCKVKISCQAIVLSGLL